MKKQGVDLMIEALKKPKLRLKRGPWPRSIIEYQSDKYRIIRKESSHYGDDDVFYIQDRVSEKIESWWDVKQDDYNTPFYSLDSAVEYIERIKK